MSAVDVLSAMDNAADALVSGRSQNNAALCEARDAVAGNVTALRAASETYRVEAVQRESRGDWSGAALCVRFSAQCSRWADELAAGAAP